VQSLIEQLGVEVVAIDGKTNRGSYDRESGVKALHMVSAWASEHRLVLGQTKVSDKSNEITAIPALLELLDIKGCIITIDAMGTQKSIAAKITGANADYVLSLKDNHPTLHQQVKSWFETAQLHGFEGIDVTFEEDTSRIRSLHGPQNFAVLRRLALNALERETSFRRNVRQKSRRTAMNDRYMLAVLAAALPLQAHPLVNRV
jgi:predicted transposase YbfD/YdcC